MNKVSSNLSDMRSAGVNTKLVEELVLDGWKFWIQTWEDRHKNEEYHDLNFQSPNMKNKSSIHHTHFGEIDRAYLFELEARAVSVDWTDALFNHKTTIQNPISEALRKHFNKTKDCRFDNIHPSEIDFQVMVAPKTQTKPKKVKVKITIE